MNDLERLLKQEPYISFLDRYSLQGRLVFMTYGGSYAYGTNVEGSDVDIRGCALNTSEEILLNHDFEQYVKNNDEMDICVYSVNKLIGLLSNCNPNTIEMLGMPIDKYAYLSDVGQLLIDNTQLFLSKRAVQSFGGYASQQLRRLGNKAVRKVSQSEREKYILDSLNNAKYSFGERYLNGMGELDLYVDDAVGEDLDQEIFMDVDLKHYPLRDYVGMISELQSIIRSYNKNSKRNEYAASHNKIGKHMMHLIRLYLMCFDILGKGQVITYRENDREYLLEIRNGRYLDENDQPTEEFYAIVDKYEARLDELAGRSKLPDNPDMDAINDLRMKINSKIVESAGREVDAKNMVGLVKMMLDYGFDVTAYDNRTGAALLTMLPYTCLGKYTIDIARCLLESGAGNYIYEDETVLDRLYDIAGGRYHEGEYGDYDRIIYICKMIEEYESS